ncbi:hypothetical protein F5050DRAFT_1713782 [Lentinula boryana]|uniref:Uncharacterized protein n=1 Tax=Lentinula boryana TaxID=40481 RepID=A0ABQ8Q732_9AGAR|nr:hypothetical protein F5050DRAFT_1713782 [Lentinula boryana]
MTGNVTSKVVNTQSVKARKIYDRLTSSGPNTASLPLPPFLPGEFDLLYTLRAIRRDSGTPICSDDMSALAKPSAVTTRVVKLTMAFYIITFIVYQPQSLGIVVGSL